MPPQVQQAPPPDGSGETNPLSADQVAQITENRRRAQARRLARASAQTIPAEGTERGQSSTTEAVGVVDVFASAQSSTTEAVSAEGNEQSSSTDQPKDNPICVICQSALSTVDNPAMRYALPCGHVFHSSCLQQYADCRGQSVEKCCPFKCQVSQLTLTVDDEDGEALGDDPVSSSLLQQATAVEEEAELIQ